MDENTFQNSRCDSGTEVIRYAPIALATLGIQRGRRGEQVARVLLLVVGLVALYWIGGIYQGRVEPATDAGTIVATLSPFLVLILVLGQALVLRPLRGLLWWIVQFFVPAFLAFIAALALLLLTAIAGQSEVPKDQETAVFAMVVAGVALLALRALTRAGHPGPPTKKLVDGAGLTLAGLLTPLLLLAWPFAASGSVDAIQAIRDPLRYDYDSKLTGRYDRAAKVAVRYYEDAMRNATAARAEEVALEVFAYPHDWLDDRDLLVVGVRVSAPASVRVHVIQVHGSTCLWRRDPVVDVGCVVKKSSFAARPDALTIRYYWSLHTDGGRPQMRHSQEPTSIRWVDEIPRR